MATKVLEVDRFSLETKDLEQFVSEFSRVTQAKVTREESGACTFHLKKKSLLQVRQRDSRPDSDGPSCWIALEVRDLEDFALRLQSSDIKFSEAKHRATEEKAFEFEIVDIRFRTVPPLPK